MKLKDFSIGQTLFGLSHYNSRYRNYSFAEYTVTGIGRKYLHAAKKDSIVSRPFVMQKEGQFEFLYDRDDRGYPIMLFPTKTDAIQYMTWQESLGTLCKIFRSSRLSAQYSSEQIKAVMDILEPAKSKPVSIRDFSIGQEVAILNEYDEAWDIEVVEVQSVTDNSVIVLHRSYDRTMEFHLANPDDTYLTECNTNKTPKLLFTEKYAAAEYLSTAQK